ncbi:MAG: hypothetical protein JWO86_6588 [Myxococcaceae bacterium]|jgi:hypothetical protein|nr:hypothetical protein [Myxococcaceae bacterium]MEA2750823.1 hypothetical protein [Myxococcales bacterium]
MGSRASAIVVVVVAGLVLAAGCSLVTSYDGFTPDGPPCGKRIPSRPPAEAMQKSGPELVGFTTALQFLEDADAGTTLLGYDLDNLCTCPDHAARSCKNPNATADQECDVANTGIDNAAGTVLGALFPATANARLQESLLHATNGLLIRVKDWDGTADDPSVSVSIWNVASLKGDTDGGAGAKLDGTDEILVDYESLLNVMDLGSKYNATTAFVSGGVLVAPLDLDFRFEIPPPNPLAGTIASIPLRSASLVGKIATKGAVGLVLTDAQLVGRLPMADVFKQVANIGICQNTPAFAGLKKPACAAFDLPLKQPGGSGRSELPCDALSFAVGLTVGPAKLAGYAMIRQAMSPCGAEPAVTCP